MFRLALIIGIYSYSIFSIGLLGILSKNLVNIFTIAFLLFLILYFKSDILSFFKSIRRLCVIKNNFFLFLLILLVTQILVNSIGVLGPEIAFDSLWYHLSLPKVYLELEKVTYIPGGLLYYSAMPKFIEMIYVGALSLGSEVLAKGIHFFLGLAVLLAIYKISRKFYSHTYALLACIIFYSSLVVGWESITAFVDLGRTFFEIMAFWAMLNFFKTKSSVWVLMSGIMLGFAIAAKLLAIGSLVIMITFLFFICYKQKISFKKSVIYFCLFILSCLFILLPWFIFAFRSTGNPIFPIFTSLLPLAPNLNLYPHEIVKSCILLFMASADPISPIFLITVPLIPFAFRKFSSYEKMFLVYSVLSLCIWYITPHLGGGRFILPYLPVISLLQLAILRPFEKNMYSKVIVMLVVFLAVISIGYRFFANVKYVPYVFGFQTKDYFLSKNLNFSFGDFYDTDGYFKKNIKKTDKILIFGTHNLYYVDFPFIHETWVKKGDEFNYVLVQNASLNPRFFFWKKIYENKTSNVILYSLGGKKWHY